MFRSDIDIDVPDREAVLKLFRHTPASMVRDGKPVKHNTGVYFTPIPRDPASGLAAIDYETAENRGYVKMDLLNMHVYSNVRDEAHLQELLDREPEWNRLQDPEFFVELVHIGNHYDLMRQMPEPIDSIPRMAMFLAIIRPGKRHLAGKTWREVAETIWTRNENEGYAFKKSHAVSYAQLVAVHMNLLCESP